MTKEEFDLVLKDRLAWLERLFQPDIRLTLVARLPGQSEVEVVVTADDLDEVIKTIERTKERNKCQSKN